MSSIRLLLIIAFIALPLFAKREFLSPIPLPIQYIYSLEPQKCDAYCLYTLYESGKYFSFLAKYDNKVASGEIARKYSEIQQELGIYLDDRAIEPIIKFEEKRVVENENTQEMTFLKEPQESVAVVSQIRNEFPADAKEIKIAVIIPKKVIGRYAINTTKALMAYLLSKNSPFSIEVFDSVNELEQSLSNTLKSINPLDFDLLIAIVTKDGANVINRLDYGGIIYIPTVLRSEIEAPRPNIYFGGIDYKKQLDKLLALSNQKIAIFSDNTPLFQNLNSYMYQKGSNIILKEELLSNDKKVLRSIFEGKKYLINNSSIFLNAQIIKSALAMSMISYYENMPYRLFGVQHLYSPMLFVLSQEKDRENLFIANSITSNSWPTSILAHLMGSDVRYDWINYSVVVGVDYFFWELNKEIERNYKESFLENQINYEIEVLKVQDSSFEKEF